jgi:hypothetical protein
MAQATWRIRCPESLYRAGTHSSTNIDRWLRWGVTQGGRIHASFATPTAQRFLGNLDGGRLVGLIDFEHVVPIPVAADAESAPRA